jgi:hypothetical protein
MIVALSDAALGYIVIFAGVGVSVDIEGAFGSEGNTIFVVSGRGSVELYLLTLGSLDEKALFGS